MAITTFPISIPFPLLPATTCYSQILYCKRSWKHIAFFSVIPAPHSLSSNSILFIVCCCIYFWIANAPLNGR